MTHMTHVESEERYCRSGVPVAEYVWPWGETGVCDAEGIVLLRQTATQLRREVHLTSLTPGASPPMERAERIELRATIATLECEVDEARQRGMELYRSVEKLQRQLELELSKQSSLSASLERAEQRVEELRIELGELRRTAAAENDELQRLRAIVRIESVAPEA